MRSYSYLTLSKSKRKLLDVKLLEGKSLRKYYHRKNNPAHFPAVFAYVLDKLLLFRPPAIIAGR